MLGSSPTGAGSVPTASEPSEGGGEGTITSVTSPDGSIDVSNPTGPNVQVEVDPSFGKIKTIESTDGSIDVTGGTGPTTNLSVADKTPQVVGKFTGAVVAGEGSTFGYMGDPGVDLAVAGSDPVDPNLYQTGARTIAALRVTANDGNAFTVAYHVTLYKNGAPTAQTVSVPAGTSAGAKFVDTGHPIAFAAGDTFDVRWDIGPSGGSPQAVSAVLEGPAGGASGAGIAGYSWLSTQLGRAAAMLPGGTPQLDDPWSTHFLIDPGKNNANQDIEFSSIPVGSGAATRVTTKPGGVYLLDTGATPNSSVSIGTPNSGSFILQNPVSGPFYVSGRCLLQGPITAATILSPVYCVSGGGAEHFQLAAGGTGLFLVMITGAGTVALGPSSLAPDLINAHDYAIGFDGTTVTAYLDGVPIPGLSTTNLVGLTSLAVMISAKVENTSDAASRTMFVDALCCLQQSMQ